MYNVTKLSINKNKKLKIDSNIINKVTKTSIPKQFVPNSKY